MNPRIIEVRPHADFTLTLTFINGEIRRFDVNPYLDKGFFRELKEPCMFQTVMVFQGSIAWAGGQDFCPDTLYLDSSPVAVENN